MYANHLLRYTVNVKRVVDSNQHQKGTKLTPPKQLSSHLNSVCSYQPEGGHLLRLPSNEHDSGSYGVFHCVLFCLQDSIQSADVLQLPPSRQKVQCTDIASCFSVGAGRVW